LQRLFSAFPAGAPGAGLLILRIGAALAALADSRSILTSDAGQPAWAAAILVCGVLLLVGLLTPVAGALLTIAMVVSAVTAGQPFDPISYRGAPLVAITLALMLLGPGWMSVDAWLFGRRRIVIPGG
jgi:uncharacterized membrane protein YphA (DoxX/SURF4 family)